MALSKRSIFREHFDGACAMKGYARGHLEVIGLYDGQK